MSPNLNSCPIIPVLRWNATNVSVECPYCEEIHRHGVALPGKRVSHCYPGGRYEFKFPIDESTGLVGYEIDKRRACFVNVALPVGQDNKSLEPLDIDERELVDRLNSTLNISATGQTSDPGLNLYEDSKEMETIHVPGDDPFEQKRILLAISECVSGDLNFISKYLDNSTEAELFLHGRDNTGHTTLLMAAAEKSHEMVSLLLDHGADANSVNNDGRSALMEATLWGRIEIVKLLLNANADKNIRDHQGRRAIDLAQPSRKNENEREWRASHVETNNKAQRDSDRRYIDILLGDSNTKEQPIYTEPLSEEKRQGYTFKKSRADSTITLYGPIQSHVVPRIEKTVAYLDRGRQFKQIPASSGWSVTTLPPNEPVRPDWIKQVFYIACTIWHEFEDPPSPSYDQGEPGRYFASHAEKKLIAYFIDKHVFLPRDREPDFELGVSIRGIEDLLRDGEDVYEAWAEVRDLEARKADLNRQLYDADHEQEVQRLKQDIHVIDQEISSLGSDADVVEMRNQEKEMNNLLAKETSHQALVDLSMHEPRISLKRAVIMSSNPICKDCERFKEKVNDCLDLNIEMSWRT